MVRTGAEDEATGTAQILEDKRRIAEIEIDLRAAGSVMTLPTARVIEAGCRRIVESGVKLETSEERRPILEKFVDLKMIYGDGEVVIEGKVPVPEAAAVSGDHKCNRRVGTDPESKGQDGRGAKGSIATNRANCIS
jgi:hypothetical protein